MLRLIQGPMEEEEERDPWNSLENRRLNQGQVMGGVTKDCWRSQHVCMYSNQQICLACFNDEMKDEQLF